MMEGSNGEQFHAEPSDITKSVEIKIKTLDSQVYSCSVDQNISVPALKEQIGGLTGVPPENQRLICRGRVLKDDHKLSDYNVEDGHTLHLVPRQAPQAGGTSSTAAAAGSVEQQVASDRSAGASHSRPPHISHSVVMGTFNVPDIGAGGLPDVNRIISSVLQSLGVGNTLPSAGTNMPGPAVNPTLVSVTPGSGQETGAGAARSANASSMQAPAAGLGGLLNVRQPFRLLQQATVIPDALTTMMEYLDGLEQALALNGSLTSQHTLPSDAAPSSSSAAQRMAPQSVISGHPTPANLGAVFRRTLAMLSGPASTELNRLSSQLEDEPSLVDTAARGELQSAALRNGVLLQHLGALLLELGRATLTLRVGTSARESTVNPGPAVFISPAGPNPMMVQPVPLQLGTGFGVSNAGTHHNSGTVGFGEFPQNVSIHIHSNDGAAIPGFPAAAQGHTPNSDTAEVPHSNFPATETPSTIREQPDAVTSTSGPETEAANTTPSLSSVAGDIGPGSNLPTVHDMTMSVQGGVPSHLPEQPGIRVLPMRAVVAAVPTALQSRPFVDGGALYPNIFHPLLARFQQLNSQQGINSSAGPAPGTPVTQVPTTGVQTATPTVRAHVVDVQAWVPDGQGGLRLVRNEEALRNLFSTTQAASQHPPLQHPTQHSPENNETISQAGVGGNGNILNRDTDNLSAVAQQVSSDIDMEPVRTVPTETCSQAEVDVGNCTSSKEQNDDGDVEAKLGHENVGLEPNGTTRNTPAGLGMGGLCPLPSRASRQTGKHHQVEQCMENQDGAAVSSGEGTSATAPRTSNAESNTRTGSQAPQFFELFNHASSRSGGGGSVNIGSFVSQLATNAGGTAATGQGQNASLPVEALGSLMSQVAQNPLMRSIAQQVVEQVGGAFGRENTAAHAESAEGAGPQREVDFSRFLQNIMPTVTQAINRVNSTSGHEDDNMRSRDNTMGQGFDSINIPNGSNISVMFQQMMPVVAQAFAGALTSRPERASRPTANAGLGSNENGNTESSAEQEGNLQRAAGQPGSVSSDVPENAPTAKRQKINVEKALEKLEQGSSSSEIVRAIAEAASMGMVPVNNQDVILQLLVQHLGEDSDLSDDYMALLLSDMASGGLEDA
ncbi:hypothetical protein KP509_07G089300 [Ceratopteris richardii]|nr:hypothetical protein KP509_07G089300 [Ceratopteris richardii]KAH7433854.1 hypothetical protein KP509_07G089300 [Ceratopteris richardii]KAH7433856.1 hypothetical protein KP509_07G089300 [Ceratopteris richardii]